MKKLVLIIGFLLSFAHTYTQSFVEFAEPPKMVLKSARLFQNYRVAYKATTKSTIYLELKKGNKLVGNGVYDITKPGKKTIVFNVHIFKGVETLPLGNDYSYHLYMYEGERNDFSKKACETNVIKNVTVVGRRPKKIALLDSLN